MEGIVSYAQNREDILLSGFFDMTKPGFYVDVGAEGATDLSVTKFFYDKGWNGINIEPIPRLYKKLVQERSRDINLNIGIANKKGNLQFREYSGSGFSTFSETMKSTYSLESQKLTKNFKDYIVETVTLADVFRVYSLSSIQFLKIDVEGFEYEVIEGNDWTKYRPQVICIEANHVQKNWRLILQNNQYEQVFFDGLNEYYIDNTQKKLLKDFSYIETIIYNEPIINAKLLPYLEDLESKLQYLSEEQATILDENLQLKEELQARIRYIEQLREHGGVASPKALAKKYVKKYLKSIDRKLARIGDSRQHVPRKADYEVSLNNDLLSVAAQYDNDNFNAFIRASESRAYHSLYMSVRNKTLTEVRKIREKQIKGSD
jgi:FkbM family methyltransferase